MQNLSVLDSILDFAVALDSKGDCIYANTAIQVFSKSMNVVNFKGTVIEYFVSAIKPAILQSQRSSGVLVIDLRLPVSADNSMSESTTDSRNYQIRVSQSPDRLYHLAMILDTTEDVLELQKSALILNRVSQAIPELVFIHELETFKILYSNHKWQEVLGYEENDIYSKGSDVLTDLLHEDDLLSLIDHQRENANNSNFLESEQEARLLHKNGDWIWFKLRQIEFTKNPRKSMLVIAEPIQKIKEAQDAVHFERLRTEHSSRMASLGNMASQMAHEINNPLAVIIARAEQLQEQIQEKKISRSEFKSHLDRILHTGSRIQKIIKTLKSFVLWEEDQPVVWAPLESVILDVTLLIEQSIGTSGLQLKVQEIPKVEVRCRLAPLIQTIHNLLSNSIDALRGAEFGWIEIGFEIDKTADKKVKIAVTDSGNGISPDTAKNLFQPFFTTKEPGQGIGLSLSLAHSILRQFQGEIYYNALSKNTQFVIALEQRSIAAPETKKAAV